MDYKATLTGLYHLLVLADDNVNEKELSFGKEMLKVEGIDEASFKTQMEELKTKDGATTLAECIAGLKKLDKKKQIRCLAWLSVIANSDGFMDKEEWELIYKIYHTELGLPLDEIMKTQKELNVLIHGKSFQSIGIRVNK
ncbi:MAG: TerB family tellurite resistance protein [Chryseolinea sp.]